LDRPGQFGEDRHIRQIGTEITKRDARGNIVPTDTDFNAGVARRGLKFLKGRPERLLERRPPVSFERFLRHEDGNQFGFGQLEQRQVGHGPSETVTAASVVEFDRQIELVAHVIEVALDRLGGDLDRTG
jgi:hypothetical protein